jgi:hypothetical protein
MINPPGRFRLRLSVALLPLLLGGCGILGLGENETRELLERNERIWSENAPARYRFVMQRLCFCGQELTLPVLVTVENGVVVSRTYVTSGHPVGAEWASIYPRIEGVFAILHQAIERNADRMDVSYDGRMGYPLSASIDYVRNAIDDELELRVTDFTTY